MASLVAVACEDGRTRWDVPGAPYADGGTHAPVRLLGDYDNVWLSHTDRERIASPQARPRWRGSNGGIASTVFVDGFLAGLWRRRDGQVVTELFCEPTGPQWAELDQEIDRMTTFLLVPADEDPGTG